MVAANRELITRFEKKIQATLARVWGEDEPAKEVSQVMCQQEAAIVVTAFREGLTP